MAIVTMVASLINENTSREWFICATCQNFTYKKAKSCPIHADEPLACASGLYWLHHR